MKKFYTLILLAFIGLSANAQTEKCGTMQNLEEMIKQDPTLKEKMEKMEIQTQEWLKNNGKLKYSNPLTVSENKTPNQKNGGNPSLLSLCGYNNTYYETIAAPTILNQIVSPAFNCTYGGEYVTVTGLIAGNIYRISTCGANNFDTQISIYTAGGGTAVAHNDDWCGVQSEIYFNPLSSGNYDVLIDEFNCLSNTLCADFEVELFYTPRPVITIPVVFHIIHNGEPIGTGRNLSTAEILSLLTVLNDDFRRMNSDINITPAAFRGASDDALIEFCLAEQDDSGDPTTGIERYFESQSNFSTTTLFSTIAPDYIWDRDSYLNIFSVDIAGSVLGVAQFPGGPASSDVVFIDYTNFGTISSNSPFDLGRTGTHEVGHWLNLLHTWDVPGCSSDDGVADTPLQDMSSPAATCSTFPVTTDICSPSYPGIMFVNYMDYSPDACLTMFTVGQAGRMDAALFGPRLSLQSSIGCQPSTVGINELNPLADVTLFPNPSNGIFSIKSSEKISSIEIVNVLGEKIYQRTTDNGLPIAIGISTNIDLSKQVKGIYFIKLISEKGTATKKLIIQ